MLHVMDHPLIHHKLGILRNKETGSKEFRELVGEIAMLMCYEVMRDLPTEEVEIETPVSKATVKQIAGRKLAFVPILRAGLGMVDAMLRLVPTAKVGHVGLYRDPETLEAVEYYCKLPFDSPNRDVFILEPMLATGASSKAAVKFIKEKGARSLTMICIIVAEDGVKKLLEEHPDVEIYCAACDKELNDHAYITPGLGDAGDRIFGTK